MTTIAPALASARDYALRIADDVQAFRRRCQLPRLVDVVRTELGVDLVVRRDPDRDLFGLRVALYADPNDAGAVRADLVTDAGERLQSMQFRTVAYPVASGSVAALVNYAQNTVA